MLQAISLPVEFIVLTEKYYYMIQLDSGEKKKQKKIQDLVEKH